MPSYKCKIAVNDGKIIERVIQSGSVNLIKKQIAEDGGFLVKAQRISGSTPFLSFFQKQRLKLKDFYSFNQEFLTLLRAGLPVVLAFDGIIEQQDKGFFSMILKNIRDDISEGESIPNAFEKYENIFSSLYIATLRSGEASGNMPDAIEEYLEYFERSRQIRQKIKAASVYPAILTICSIFVVAFLIIFVVPSITGTFVEAGAQLPFFTRILLQFSYFIRSYFWVISGGIIFTIWLVSFCLKTKQGKLLFDTHYLKIPFIGELSVIYSTALFTSSLSTVLRGGIPLNQALQISKGLISNSFMQAGIKNALLLIEQGEGFALALKKVDIFPGMALRMVAAGEEGGNLEKVLKDIAVFYEKDVAAKLSIITSTIEPVLMVLMGFVIGFIMLAMYMPIFQMAGTMG
ncbi:MAG: type II secretion system F family protein [Desulfobacula sp.]|uniref:type II secretion system F family protein n=1 Tax=Desulfobacula sp. TaxID=2593537 RepID=UPI0025C547CA|nr:type II secretion system F family protein [Desulfobacula sp.]MCD4721230.1 type II secretion system F family protein [Desulfobacula sp.]